LVEIEQGKALGQNRGSSDELNNTAWGEITQRTSRTARLGQGFTEVLSKACEPPNLLGRIIYEVMMMLTE